jgi:hypothetical protein
METRNILTVTYFVLAIYMYGGGVMSTLVYYQSWKLVGEGEFAAVHSSVTRRNLPYFGPVLVLLVLVNVLLIWFHHPAISTWLIVLTAAIHLLMMVIRFAVFVPIHKKLDQAKSMELIDRLLKYDMYLGSGIPASIKMIVTIVMLYQVVSAT